VAEFVNEDAGKQSQRAKSPRQPISECGVIRHLERKVASR
jgi:hypothetical protein